MKAYRVSTFPDGKIPVIEPDGRPYEERDVDLIDNVRVYFTKKRNTAFENVLAIYHHWFAKEEDARAFALKLMDNEITRAVDLGALLMRRRQNILEHGRVQK